MAGSYEFQSFRSENYHAEENGAVSPPLNIGFSIEALLVANRNIHNLHVLLICSEKQFKVAERIEIAEIRSTAIDAFVVRSPHDFSTAQGVLHGLTEQPREDHAECLVRAKIGELHRLPRHRVNQPHAVGEITFPRGQHLDELRQILRGHREVRIEDHKDVSGGRAKTLSLRVSLAFAGLAHLDDPPVGKRVRQALNSLPRVVLGMALNEKIISLALYMRVVAWLRKFVKIALLFLIFPILWFTYVTASWGPAPLA